MGKSTTLISLLLASCVLPLFFFAAPLALGIATVIFTLIAAFLRKSRSLDWSVDREAPSRIEEMPPLQFSVGRHREVRNVDAEVFDDLVRIEAEALKNFSIWMRDHRGAPKDPQRFVIKSEVGTRFVGRLVSDVEKVQVVWESAPYRGTAEIDADPSTGVDGILQLIDSEIRERSRHIVMCEPCDGRGVLTCERCYGETVVTCSNCDGNKKAYGIAINGSRRLMKCKVCEAQGVVTCPSCEAGTVKCPDCEGFGKLSRWAEPVRTLRHDVQLEPDGKLISAFEWGADGVVATDESISKDAEIHHTINASNGLKPEQVRELTGKEWFDKHWDHLQPAIAEDERIVTQKFQLIEVPSVAVTWTLDNTQRWVTELQGRRMLVPPPLQDRLVFQNRIDAIGKIALASALFPLFLVGSYAVRGAYFLRADVGASIALVGISATLLSLSFRKIVEADPHRHLPAYGAVFAMLSASALSVRAEPTPATVEQLIERQAITQAEQALYALHAVDAQVSNYLRRKLDLLIVLQATSSEVAFRELQRLDANTEERKKAELHLDTLLLNEIRNQISVGNFREAEKRLDQIVHAKPQGSVLRKELNAAIASDCLEKMDYPCAIRRSRDAGDEALQASVISQLKKQIDDTQNQLRAVEQKDPRSALVIVNKLVPRLEDLTLGEPAAQSALQNAKNAQKRIASRVQVLDEKERERVRKLAEAEARRLKREKERAARAAAAAAKREAEQEARERRRATMPRRVQCCDGTFSPTCYYGGSLRGCCSSHGGTC